MEPKRIDLFGVFQDLYTKGYAKFSDHVINENEENKNESENGNARKD